MSFSLTANAVGNDANSSNNQSTDSAAKKDPRPAGPSYLKLIIEGILRTKTGGRGLSSRQAIHKYILENHSDKLSLTSSAVFERSFRAALRRAVEQGLLAQFHQSFRIVAAKKPKVKSRAQPKLKRKVVDSKKTSASRKVKKPRTKKNKPSTTA